MTIIGVEDVGVLMRMAKTRLGYPMLMTYITRNAGMIDPRIHLDSERIFKCMQIIYTYKPVHDWIVIPPPWTRC